MANRFAKYAQPELVNQNPMFPGQLQGQGLNNQGQALQNSERAATLPYAQPKAAADTSNAQTQAAVNAATAPAEIKAKNAGARKNSVDATVAETNLATTGGADATQSKNASFYTRAAKSNKLFEGTGINDDPASHELAKTLLPDALVNQFTSAPRQQAEAAQRDFIAATLRYESGAAIPPSEFENQRQIFFPAPGDDPSTVKLKAQLRKNAIDGLRLSAGPAAPMLDKQVVAPPDATTHTVPFKDGSQLIDAMIASNVPYKDALRQYRQQFPDAPVFEPSQYNQALIYHRRHPNENSGYGAATKVLPLSDSQQKNNKFAQSPLGAALSSAGSAATFGLDDEIAGGINALKGGDYTEGRDFFNAGKQQIAAQNPLPALAGTVLGSAGTMAGINKLAGPALGKLLAPAERYSIPAAQAAATGASRAGLAADVGYGTAYGVGESNDNRFAGAGLGGLSALGGNLAGRTVANTLGAVVSPTGGKLRPLYDMGVRPSVGQRLGGIANSAEEKLQSFPVLGDFIAGTRNRARDQFQLGLFNDALGDIGTTLPKGMEPGHGAHAFAQDSFNRAYDAAKSGMTAAADNGLATDLGELQRTISTLKPDSQSAFNKLWADSVGRRFKGGALAGNDFKAATSELEKKIAAIRSNKTGDGELADALQQAHDALRASAVRNSPPEAVAALDAADKGYAKLVRLEEASRKAGEPAEFSPSQYNTAVKTASGGVRNRAYLRGDALNSEIAQLGTRLGDKVSNSGTIDRLLPFVVASGAGYVSPPAGAALGGFALMNAPGVRNLLTGAMAPRNSEALRQAAEQLRRLSAPTGTAGSALGLGIIGPR